MISIRYYLSIFWVTLPLLIVFSCTLPPKGIDLALVKLAELDDNALISLFAPETTLTIDENHHKSQLRRAEHIQVKVAGTMLKSGAHIDARNEEGQTPLILSAIHNRGYLASMLLQEGPRTELKDKQDRSANDYAWMRDDSNLRLLFIFREKLEEPHPSNDINKMFARASTEGSASAISYLIDKGADPDFVIPEYNRFMRPLHKAAFYGHDEAVRCLLSRGADINATNSDGMTPLHIAVDSLNERYENNNNGLNIIELLLDSGASTEIDCSQWGTALKHAVHLNKKEAVLTLLSHGADPTYIDKYGNSLLQQTEDPEILSILVDHGADINNINNSGETLLMYAVENHYTNLVKTCIGLGADPNISGAKGKTALNLTESPQIISLLKSAGAKR